MSARMRVGWGLVIGLWVGGSAAEADFLSSGRMSEVNLTTGLPSWQVRPLFRAPTNTNPYHAPPAVTQPVVVQPAPAPPPALPQTFAPTAPAPVTTPTPAPVAATADALVNLGSGPYPEANLITSGNAQPWYNSPGIAGFFGGQPPSAQQQADFTSTVMRDVQQTFASSNVAVSLTSDPTVSAPHTLSLVSNTSAAILPTAIGMTDIGANGFSFIDQEAKSAQTLGQLEWIVAHNISHELMLAFGVGENYDTSGNFIDARNASLAMMINPSSSFSSGAAAALNQALAAAGSTGATAAQVIAAKTVPEPGTVAVWSFGMLAVAAFGCRVKGRESRSILRTAGSGDDRSGPSRRNS